MPDAGCLSFLRVRPDRLEIIPDVESVRRRHFLLLQRLRRFGPRFPVGLRVGREDLAFRGERPELDRADDPTWAQRRPRLRRRGGIVRVELPLGPRTPPAAEARPRPHSLASRPEGLTTGAAFSAGAFPASGRALDEFAREVAFQGPQRFELAV